MRCTTYVYLRGNPFQPQALIPSSAAIMGLCSFLESPEAAI